MCFRKPQKIANPQNKSPAKLSCYMVVVSLNRKCSVLLWKCRNNIEVVFVVMNARWTLSIQPKIPNISKRGQIWYGNFMGKNSGNPDIQPKIH